MHDRDRRLATAIRALIRDALPRRRERPPASDTATRLDYLERDVSGVRTRVNALFFAVLSVALGDLVGRLVLS